MQLLEAFASLARRDEIKRAVDKRTIDVWTLFQSELSTVRRTFDNNRRDPPLQASYPHFAGRAMWANTLLQRIKQQFEHLQAIHHFTPSPREAEEARFDYQDLVQALEGYIQRYHGLAGVVAGHQPVRSSLLLLFSGSFLLLVFMSRN